MVLSVCNDFVFNCFLARPRKSASGHAMPKPRQLAAIGGIEKRAGGLASIFTAHPIRPVMRRGRHRPPESKYHPTPGGIIQFSGMHVVGPRSARIAGQREPIITERTVMRHNHQNVLHVIVLRRGSLARQTCNIVPGLASPPGGRHPSPHPPARLPRGERKREAGNIFRGQFPMNNARRQRIRDGDRVIRKFSRGGTIAQ